MKLTPAELQSALANLPQWTLDGDKLRREYRFPDFTLAFSFMTLAAFHIEALNHHPEWCNVYGKVLVHLTTHDAGGITNKDVQLAARLEELSIRFLGWKEKGR